MQRYNSRSGSLVKLNGVELALFRLGNRVYGIEEKCPHAGNYSYRFFDIIGIIYAI